MPPLPNLTLTGGAGGAAYSGGTINAGNGIVYGNSGASFWLALSAVAIFYIYWKK